MSFPGDGLRSVCVAGDIRQAQAWIVAGVLRRVLGPQVPVQLVHASDPAESASRSVIASRPGIGDLFALLGLDERVVAHRANAIYTLGTKVEGLGSAGEYVQPFGEIGVPLAGVPFHQHWLCLRQRDASLAPIEAFSLAARAGRAGRFAPPATDAGSVLSTIAYGLQLDGRALLELCRTQAERLGVTIAFNGEPLADVHRDQHERIDTLVLSNGARVQADLFVDVSANGALISTLPGGDWVDWAALFGHPSCQLSQTEPSETPHPLTRLHAGPDGWQVTLATRTQSQSITYRLGGGHGAPMALGRRRQLMVGNCLALGPAAFGLPAIEAPDLHLLHRGLRSMLQIMPTRRFDAGDAREYTRLAGQEIDGLRDWQLMILDPLLRMHAAIGDQIAQHTPMVGQRLALWDARGRVMSLDGDLADQSAQVACFLGQGRLPRALDPLASVIPIEAVRTHLLALEGHLTRGLAQMPGLPDFLAQLDAFASARA